MVQADPEGFIRSLDADTGPDADNPRACGVALLLCMLRKGSSHVAEAMLSYVTHLQVCTRRPALCSALCLCLAFCSCPLPSAFICLLALVTSWLWACWALEKMRLACSGCTRSGQMCPAQLLFFPWHQKFDLPACALSDPASLTMHLCGVQQLTTWLMPKSLIFPPNFALFPLSLPCGFLQLLFLLQLFPLLPGLRPTSAHDCV
jgi:hypothetical protein